VLKLDPPFEPNEKRDLSLLLSENRSSSVKEGIFRPEMSRFESLMRITSGDEDFRRNPKGIFKSVSVFIIPLICIYSLNFIY
jgi:hypothetical protein